MTAQEKAMLTYKLIEKRKEKKKEQERQLRQDKGATGWIGYNKFMVKCQKNFY